MVIYEEEIRGSYIHFTLYENTFESEPIGFIRVTPEQAPLYKQAFENMRDYLVNLVQTSQPKITSG